MAASIKILWLADTLRAAGLPVEEVPGWEDRGRPPSTGGFDPVGVLMHHTAGAMASSATPRPSFQICVDGRPDLIGPLCHVLLDWDGVCVIVAAGRANHAGTAVASGPVPAGSGNELYVGIEIDYAVQDASGNFIQGASDRQQANAVIATAAILKKLGKGPTRARAHRETSTTGKIDPKYFGSMNDFRDSVRQAMK